ncbi:uncharacterized protein LOC133542475 isoform X4 [Nerophis ophidion]|uniref:uncharacterized protein LOC133542475 isoform X4 n=1 Tax=Nerophis ophidion TaxID=159077 RepID=UPI002ADF89A8|nr:uncharacterized protein LOC133542475 isoform X4 [Nerophis ophidion]
MKTNHLSPHSFITVQVLRAMHFLFYCAPARRDDFAITKSSVFPLKGNIITRPMRTRSSPRDWYVTMLLFMGGLPISLSLRSC